MAGPPPNKKTQNKKQLFSLRIDDKTRFQLDFCARITGMSITTFIERAISEKANEVEVEAFVTTEESTQRYSFKWSDYWDPDEGIRIIKMLSSEGMNKYTTYEEDQLILFLNSFSNFFSRSCNLLDLSREHVNALWPYVPELLETWESDKMKNTASHVENQMEAILDRSNLTVPGVKW